MPSTYTPNLGLEQPATGDKVGTWGVILNTVMSLIDSAVEGVLFPDLTGLSTYTLTTTNGAVSNGRQAVVHFTGLPTGNVTATVAPNTSSKVYLINNNMAGGFSVTVTQGSGATVTVANGYRAIVYCDGLGSGASVYNLFDDSQLSQPSITGTISGNPTLPYLNAKIDGSASVDLTGLASYTLDISNLATGVNRVVTFTGQASTSPCVITLSPNSTAKILFAKNNLVLSADFAGSDISVKQGSGRSVTVASNGSVGSIIADGGGATANCDSIFTQVFQGGPSMASNDIPYWDTSTGRVGLSGLSYGTGPQVKAGARWTETCPNTAPTDGDIQNSQYSVWLNESTNALTFRVRKSDGTYLTGTVTLA